MRRRLSVGARAMGDYHAPSLATSAPSTFKGPLGPLSGRRVRIHSPYHMRSGLTGRLTYGYLHLGAYYARIDGQNLETVVRPHEWELLPT